MEKIELPAYGDADFQQNESLIIYNTLGRVLDWINQHEKEHKVRQQVGDESEVIFNKHKHQFGSYENIHIQYCTECKSLCFNNVWYTPQSQKEEGR